MYRVQAWKMKMLEGQSHWKTLYNYPNEEVAYEKMNELEEEYEDAQFRVLNTDLAERD